MAYSDKNKQREYCRLWTAARRKKWLDENGPCKECGATASLEVHHVDPAQKISHNVWSWSEQRRLAELSKCIVLCYDCHIRVTAEQKRKPVVHGKSSTYKSGCRCSECRVAHTIEHAQWRKSKLYR